MDFYWLWMLYLWLAFLCVYCQKSKDGAAGGGGPETMHYVGAGEDVEFAAIKTIHRQLDDNADGNVDLSESAEFVQTELCGAPADDKDEVLREQVCRGSEKSLKFHRLDKEITSTELWVNWHQNEVFNWTSEDVVEWLEVYVELPQYSDTFRRNEITGRQLPYLAINARQILQNSLMITDSQHKRKIQLRAMDIVLFGPPVQRGHWKDYIWKLSLLWAICGVVYIVRQRKISKSRMDSFMEDLRRKEEELTKLRSKFEAIDRDSSDGSSPDLSQLPCDQQEGEDVSVEPLMMAPIRRNDSSSGSEDNSPSVVSCKTCSSTQGNSALTQVQETAEVLQQRVWSLEEELEAHHGILHFLQEVLPECQGKEREQLEFRKSVVEEQMSRAQRACEKIRKRRSSIFGTFHLANSSVLEEAGLEITKAVNKMQLISELFEDHHKRWHKIGSACGFHASSPLMKSPSSHSPPVAGGGGKSTVITQQAINPYLRFNRRSSSSSVFSTHSGQSDFVYPSSHPYPNPMTRFSHMPRIQSGSLPRPPSNLTQTPEASSRTLPPSIPDLSDEVEPTDSLLDSTSSSSSSIPRLYATTCVKKDKQTEPLQSPLSEGKGSGKDSREGSADVTDRLVSGKVQSREKQRESRSATPGIPTDSPDGGKRGEQLERVKASPRVSPRVSPRASSRASPKATSSPKAAVRNRTKRATFSSDV